MRIDCKIDVIEQDIADRYPGLLNILLFDRTTRRNIIWATTDYESKGALYKAINQILPELIIGVNTRLIQPRTAKSESEQLARTQCKAEVFTPPWVCNAQNNLIDDAWFKREHVFNTPEGATWRATSQPIVFPEDKRRTWQKYVDARRMEIACGEAPYLTSRYNTTTGEFIALQSRIGLLDRKLRVVTENTRTKADWLKWTFRAYQSIYAFEYQGDNLFLARENVLLTFMDNYSARWSEEPSIRDLRTIARIASWNLWQMDAMTCTIPYGQADDQTELFEASTLKLPDDPRDAAFFKFCRIMNWRSKQSLEYRKLVKGGGI